MSEIKHDEIGKRLQEVRKKNGYNQTELAEMLGKSLRTIQKYESGEIEISVAMLKEIAKKLNTTTIYLLGNQTNPKEIGSFGDVVAFLLELEKTKKFGFEIDVKRPPHAEGWQCSIVFDGKDKNAYSNADMCLFLEDWKLHREGNYTQEQYEEWKDQTLAYHSYAELLSKDYE